MACHLEKINKVYITQTNFILNIFLL